MLIFSRLLIILMIMWRLYVTHHSTWCAAWVNFTLHAMPKSQTFFHDYRAVQRWSWNGCSTRGSWEPQLEFWSSQLCVCFQPIWSRTVVSCRRRCCVRTCINFLWPSTCKCLGAMERGSRRPFGLSDQLLHSNDQLVNVSKHLLKEESGLWY